MIERSPYLDTATLRSYAWWYGWIDIPTDPLIAKAMFKILRRLVATHELRASRQFPGRVELRLPGHVPTMLRS